MKRADPLRGLRVPELVELVERLARLASLQPVTLTRLAAEVRHRRLTRAEQAATELLNAHRGPADGVAHRRCALCVLLEEQVAVALDLASRSATVVHDARLAEEDALGLVAFTTPEATTD